MTILIVVMVWVVVVAPTVSCWFTYDCMAAPFPTASADETYEGSVRLDADHRFAVQPFIISAAAADVATVKATMSGNGHQVRLALLADIAPGQAPMGKVTYLSDRIIWVDKTVGEVQYLAIVELVPASNDEVADVDLSLQFHAFRIGTSVALGIGRIARTGPFAVRPVSVVETTITQTVGMTPSGAATGLKLGMEGAARPIGRGGSGRLSLTIRGISHVPPGPGLSSSVGLGVAPLDVGFSWDSFSFAKNPPAAAGDPTVGCPTAATTCDGVDLTVYSKWFLWKEVDGMVPGQLQPGSPPVTAATATYVIEVRSYLLDIPTVPEGARLTLEARQ